MTDTPRTDRIRALLDREVMGTYARFPLALERGDGCRVWDADGREYLDFTAGIAVSVLGHGHPAVVGAIREAAGRLLHTSNLYHVEAQARLAERLNRLAGMERAFFCNSGAEANEAAIKLARRWGRSRRPDAHEVVSAEGSFHGRTLATLAATGQPHHREGFEPLPSGFRQVPWGDIPALDRALTPRTCALLLEAVQGEGGVLPAPPGYLEGAARLCREREILLIVDEVQTGLGRTGRWFAFQHHGIEPDVVTLAKALGGGIPIGACLARGGAAGALEPGTHASTFGGNPFACTVALAVVEAIDREGLVERAARLGGYLMDALGRRLAGPATVEVRGRGLLVGVERTDAVAPIVDAALARGLLVLPAGPRVLRLLPPLVASEAEADRAVDLLVAAAAA